jgi:hypothetical protein
MRYFLSEFGALLVQRRLKCVCLADWALVSDMSKMLRAVAEDAGAKPLICAHKLISSLGSRALVTKARIVKVRLTDFFLYVFKLVLESAELLEARHEFFWHVFHSF